MNRTGYHHLVPGLAVLALAIVVTWLSYTQVPAEAYLFPRLISLAMLALAGWNFVRAATGMARVGSGIELTVWKRILPGIAVALIFVFWAAKGLGFYLASTIAFFAIYSLYDPSSHLRLSSWIKRGLSTAGFIVVIYLLFAVLLRVQTPRGIML